jgi:hypothetical protein
MSKPKVEQAVPVGQSNSEVALELRVLRDLVAETMRKVAGRGRAEAAVDVDDWLRRCTPDQLLDRWMAVRGEQAEAYLRGRIDRRRVRRQAAL